jgi:TrmH family RNA methyltransferase
MPQTLGAYNARIARARDLLSNKGREQHGAFAIEGATLLDEAVRCGVTPESLFVTPDAFEGSATVRELDARGVPTYLVGDRTFAKISDLESPTGVLAIAPQQLRELRQLLERPGLYLILADISDPGNAGALLRSAEAFGALGAVFGSGGVDPYHPKVVRAAMGAAFRLPLAVGTPEAVAQAARAGGVILAGLAAGRTPIEAAQWAPATGLVVGHERRGLGVWEGVCERLFGIPMAGQGESLNAAVAGSIALYEAAKHTPGGSRNTL